jgi:hypothetical protein
VLKVVRVKVVPFHAALGGLSAVLKIIDASPCQALNWV